jgi:DNA invertase Pin-like site-specific DNA recombinase
MPMASPFVSVTQSFNTASSMGRLTLNMLLSFAQFEREVIGERLRDKIAAKKLEIVPEEADPRPHGVVRSDATSFGRKDDVMSSRTLRVVPHRPRTPYLARSSLAPIS